MLNTRSLRHGSTSAADEAHAAEEIHEQLHQDDAAGYVLFCSSQYDLDRLGPELADRFGPHAIGCSTLGEIGPEGYASRSIVGFSLAEAYGLHSIFELSLDPQMLAQDVASVTASVRATSHRPRAPTGEKAFGMLLVDGLSGVEELLMTTLQSAMPEVAIVGGSASENLQFDQTSVLGPSGFASGKAVLMVVHTNQPFRLINSHHFEPTNKKLVITGAVPDRRTVTEINGRPAALEYAKALGVDRAALVAEDFCHRPLMLRALGNYYVRSVRSINEDDSIEFYCAIDEGLVITLGEPKDYIETLESALEDAKRPLPNSELVFGVECVLRRLEVERCNLTRAAGEVMSRHGVIGFHSYGEQIHGLHVNQTFTGIALGSS